MPLALLEIIAAHKQQNGYLVGIDEILMGFHRTGKLFSHTDTPVSPDIVTFSKALSDATFPIGMTLVAESVYQKPYAQTRRRFGISRQPMSTS